MRLIEFTRDMRPFCKGDTRAVPDDVATKLIDDGDAVGRPSVFDAQPADSPLARAKPYFTRKQRK